MFISKEWEDGKLSKEAAGKKFYNLVTSNKFWQRVLYAINVFEPLLDVLRRMGSGILSMGYIYGDLANAKMEITLRFEHKEDHYLPIWNIIDKRCDANLKTPLHLAGYYLNPFYPNEIETENLEIFTDAVFECACNMYKDQSTQEKIVYQLKLYWTASKSSRRPLPVHQSTQMNPDPVFWWVIFIGDAAEELKTMALRILRLTCGSLACERSWIEKIHEKKPCRVTCKQFNDLAYVMLNLRLQAKERRRNPDPLVPFLPDDEEPYESFVDMDDNGDVSLEAHKNEISAILTGRPSGSGGERPSHSDKKRKNTRSTCQDDVVADSDDTWEATWEAYFGGVSANVAKRFGQAPPAVTYGWSPSTSPAASGHASSPPRQPRHAPC